jgi:hypothetical protein
VLSLPEEGWGGLYPLLGQRVVFAALTVFGKVLGNFTVVQILVFT